MSVSFEGVGQVCTTFLGGGLTEGHVVKLTGNGTVGACSDGDGFIGVAVCCKDDACTVQVGGFVTVGYSGDMPEPGTASLCARGRRTGMAASRPLGTRRREAAECCPSSMWTPRVRP